MIIVDDGSTDNTSGIIAKYQDPRIKYIYQNNLGPYRLGDTYNKALSLSGGEFLAILEGDDFWPADKLAYQIKLFDDPQVVLSHGKFQYVYTLKNGAVKKITSTLCVIMEETPTPLRISVVK